LDLTILNSEIQEFINRNIAVKITKLALQKNPFPVEWIAILNQIEQKQKQKKLPSWFNAEKSFIPVKFR
jgi:hypothetical protein